MKIQRKIRCMADPKLLFILIVLAMLSQMVFAQIDEKICDSLRRAKEQYFGYTISFASKTYPIESDIHELNGISGRREGGSAGLFGDSNGMWRAALGLYYSAPSLPYSIDLMDWRDQDHFIYCMLNLSGHIRLSWTDFSQMLTGIGAEYQLVNEKLDFLHFFLEVRYGFFRGKRESLQGLGEYEGRATAVCRVWCMPGNIK